MNKLISANYWFGCDWVFYEVGYLGRRAGQLSLACAVVYLWNTGYLRVTRPRLYPGIQHFLQISQVQEIKNQAQVFQGQDIKFKILEPSSRTKIKSEKRPMSPNIASQA